MSKFFSIKKRADFLLTQQRGNNIKRPWFILIQRHNGLPHHRFGFTISKKMGHAVTRHRIKRRWRSILQDLLKTDTIQNLPPYSDFVFIATPKSLDNDFLSLQKAMKESINDTIKKGRK